MGWGREDDGEGRREGTLGWGFEQGDVVVGGCESGWLCGWVGFRGWWAVMLFHSCQNWQFSLVFCGFTLGMA